MTKYFFIFLILSSIQKVFSQNTFKTIIKDSSTNETLIGARASIKGTNNGALANEKGEIILSNILNGKQIIRLSDFLI
jgi:iron complex outermembrane receptor protein